MSNKLIKLILNPIRGFLISRCLVNTLICVMLQIMLNTPILFQHIAHNYALLPLKNIFKTKNKQIFHTAMFLHDIFLPFPVCFFRSS